MNTNIFVSVYSYVGPTYKWMIKKNTLLHYIIINTREKY